MTSCVFSIFFLISLFSSNTAANPAGLKIRITSTALPMLKAQALAFIQENMVNAPFPDFEVARCKLQRLTITKLILNDSDLRFRENLGFQLVIQGFSFSASFDRQINLCVFEDTGTSTIAAGGINADIEVRLLQNAGHLNVAMSNCRVSADNLVMTSTGTLSLIWNTIQQALRYLFNKWFCSFFVERVGLPKVNQMLDTVVMNAPVYRDFGIYVQFSLTKNVEVTATSLDMSFSGLFYRQGDVTSQVNNGMKPVFRESHRMIYFGFSEIFFNSAAMSFYNAGTLEKKFETVTSRSTKVLLRFRQFFTEPWRLNAPLVAEVKLTETPRIALTESHGLTIDLRVRVQVLSAPLNREPHVITSVSATCNSNVKVDIQGNRLTLPYNDISCAVVTRNVIRDIMVKPLNSLLTDRISDFLASWFSEGVVLPLPEGVIFTQGLIKYHDGFVLVGGDLTFTPAGRRNIRDFVKEPWRLNAPLVAEVKLTETPRIALTESHGLTIDLRVRVQVLSAPQNREPHVITSVSATCNSNVKVDIQGNRLTLPYNDISCAVVTRNVIRDIMVKPLNSLLTDRISDFLASWFSEGVVLPLPEGVIFTQGLIKYHDGFVLVGGDLTFTPAGRRNIRDFGR
ncbi:phospholipid transfer protein-like [Mastacembelus armatus]|uniref:phospholipid transfer protein-like n=1 Tax=Mastacembelus armatus TaxID=205130 RepID=UPI000E458FF5|nr:phospholipid transfer protein-like [Mastacembelus armatus]